MRELEKKLSAGMYPFSLDFDTTPVRNPPYFIPGLSRDAQLSEIFAFLSCTLYSIIYPLRMYYIHVVQCALGCSDFGFFSHFEL
jgi:hypothetical protein